MAVTFKVPSSPKRDIFVIDNFMGVDLTNTGSNIEEIRSPNAENMVRYVPGKVRKRMGYSVPVEFSNGKDINRAVNSSNEYVDVEFDENNDAVFPIYDDNISVVSLHFYWCIVGDYTIFVEQKSARWAFNASATLENPIVDESRAVYKYICTYGGFYRLRIHKNSNSADDYCRISGLRICHATKANTDQEWRYEIPWKPAPEDNGNAFILTDGAYPVYGHHTLRTGKKQGDFVTNVNRALQTSDTYETQSENIMFELGEIIPKGKMVHIKFDYNAPTPAYIYACTNPFSGTGDAISLLVGEDTYEDDFTAPHDFASISLGSSNTEIKNFIITYANTDDYSWSPAPEDNGASFDVNNVYQKTGDNTSVFSSKAETRLFPSGGSQFECPATIQQSTTAVIGELTVVDFELTATLSKGSGSTLEPVDIDSYLMNAVMSDGTPESLYYINGTPDNKRFVLYIKPDNGVFVERISLIAFPAEPTSTFTDCTINIKNLTVHKGIEQTDFMSSSYINLYHVGKELYANKSGTTEYVSIYSDMNQQRSQSWQFEARDNESALLGYDNLYIVDGKTFLEYNGASNSVSQVNGTGRIPLVTFAKEPNGGGIPYYPINRLQPGFEEQFIGDGSSVIYQLTFGNLDLSPNVRAWIKDRDDGSWYEVEEGVDFTVNYGLGCVFFTTPPWDNTQGGEDNVRIRAYRTVERYANSINKCSFGTLFGVGGTSDRLFLSGNPDTPNYDYFSQDYDPTYFPDTNYAALGISASEIKGYARVNNYLATFKDENEPSQSVFIREGDLIVNEETNVADPAFKLINTLQGNGAISPHTFGYLQTEPLFLTKSGIYAITAQDITGEKYGQSRSFYLNGKLLKEANLESACAVVYNDQYILAINGNLYILDGLQATRTDRSEPYATRQYVGFFCTGIPANVMWTYDDSLWFGTVDGRICRFATDIESLDSYNDDGKAIYCCWETPDLDGKLFYKNKTFRYFAIRMMSALRTSAQMWSQRLGEWTFIKESSAIGKEFDFNDIDFTLFSFRSDNSEKVAHAKVRVKKVDKARFRVENGRLNEPFGLFDLALEYIESGNYKR